MKNIELKQIVEDLLKDERVKSFEITWNGDLGEYPGEIVKPNIKIIKHKKKLKNKCLI